MDRPHTRRVSKPTPRRIGIIGRTTLSDQEEAAFVAIGAYIAALGHTLIYIPAKGTATHVREGAEVEGGETVRIEAGVLESSDHTFVYPDTRLLSRLRKTYPDIESRSNVTIIEDGQLNAWLDAIKTVVNDHGLALTGGGRNP